MHLPNVLQSQGRGSLKGLPPFLQLILDGQADIRLRGGRDLEHFVFPDPRESRV
jgi:hypothetical protein